MSLYPTKNLTDTFGIGERYQHHRHRDILRRIVVSRPFTIYQLANLVDHLRVMTGEVITSPVTGTVLYTAPARFGYGHSGTPERPMVRSTAVTIYYSVFHWLSRNRPRSWQVRPSERNDR
ncbi:MAG: hypothetical protein WAK17_09920 [Candidatus Nitrosopolaris sp.]